MTYLSEKSIVEGGLHLEDEKETLTLEDMDILGSIGSDFCESVRDLIYNIKTIKNDVDRIKEYLHLSNQ